MRTCGRFLLVVLAALISVGCVAQSEVDNRDSIINDQKDRIEELKGRIYQLQAALEALQNQPPKQDPKLLAALDEYERLLATEKEKHKDELEKYKQTIRDMAKINPNLPLLPKELDDALVQLAKDNPQLMSYDPQRGMIRVASSAMTFNLGKTDLKQSAVAGLQQLARILTSTAASNFEIRVVGHTDNVPVKNPRNKEKYEDNWGLSAFRAITVMRVLVRAGVNPGKIAIVGRGEHRPVVPNTDKGAEANRRVEIYLVPLPPDPDGEPIGPTAGGAGDDDTDTGGMMKGGSNGGSTDPPPLPPK